MSRVVARVGPIDRRIKRRCKWGRLVEGQDVRFTIEGTLRVWNVPSYRINGKLVEGWTMIRIEAAAVIGSQPQ